MPVQSSKGAIAMALSLPQPIADYFEADRGGADSVANCFAQGAVVKDEGNTYRGIDEIRQWRADVAAKYTYTCQPLAAEQQDDRTMVTCRLEGNFPGSPVNLRFIFRLAGNKIQGLEIVP
jgi:hypothetical protein